MDFDIVAIALNLMMSDYKDNGNIDDTSKQFPSSIMLEALVSCLLYTSPSPRDVEESRMPSSA